MKAQINALTSTRAVAAIMVVIHHFADAVFPFSALPKVFHSGNIAVSYFFVLSGFVLFISYHDETISFGDFFKRRVARIVPVYILALVLMILVAACFLNYSLNDTAFKEIALSGLFLQAYVPSYPLVLNSPAWTISVEMFFYALFPLLLLLLNKNRPAFVSVMVLLFLLAQYFHLKYYAQRWSLPDSIVDTVFFNPVMHINQFLIGMTGGYLFLNKRTIMPKSGWVTLALFGLMVALIAARPDKLSYQVGLIAPVFMLFIFSVAVSQPTFLNAKAFVFLGEISYGIYILQFPIFKFLKAINERYMHISVQYFFFIGLAVLLVVSALSYVMFEKPLRRKINTLKFA